MSNILHFDSVTWEGQLANEIFIKPAFTTPAIESEVTVWLGVKSKRQMVLDTNLQDIVTASSGCGRTTTGDVIDITDKFVETCDAKINLEQCAKNLQDTFMEEFLRTGNASLDLTGTEVQSYIEKKVLEALKTDLYNIMWFGDTNSAYATLATCDGLWKKLIAGVGAYTVQRAYVFSSTSLYECEALAVLRALVERADPLLDSIPESDKYIMLTRGLYDNYTTCREDACWGDMSWAEVEKGRKVYYFRGIEVRKASEWTRAITHYGLSYPHRGIYTTKANLFMGTDAISDTTTFEMFYDKRDKLNYIDGEFKIGVNYAYDELTALAY